MVAGDALRTHRTELAVQPGPELLQSHAPTLTRPWIDVPRPAYADGMIPGTGSDGWDLVLQIGIVLALLVAIVLMIKNYRDR